MVTAREIGELCRAGDWAVVHDDRAALAEVVRKLAWMVGEPLHCECIALVELCRHDPRRALARWPALRERAFRVEPPA
ncbi:MAG: hypothetical protein K8W52_23415 [Deltaproteobacteria bacterium]|nr:hypothetical protein [Deltaproteobacteria bacterium]